jgi:hypothetical protein
MNAETINDFFSFLYTGRLAPITFWVKIISGLISSILFAGFVLVVIKFNYLTTGRTKRLEAAKKVQGETPKESPLDLGDLPIPPEWEDITKLLESDNPASWNIAVIRADALFDSVLKDLKLEGTTFAERLQKLTRAQLSSLDQVWEAHRTRNRIAHDTDPVLTQGEARHAIGLFAQGFRELGFLPPE